MRAAEHILGGVITTTITYLAVSAILREPVTFEGLVVAGLVGVPAGLLLDWIEPANHPHHRGPAHSTVAFAGLLTLGHKVWNDPNLLQSGKVWTTLALAGVCSHHVLDATTTMGLPFSGLHF
jgi:membrane-bound metal-dependent hydrolase YbcI (DUF457 family)